MVLNARKSKLLLYDIITEIFATYYYFWEYVSFFSIDRGETKINAMK